MSEEKDDIVARLKTVVFALDSHGDITITEESDRQWVEDAIDEIERLRSLPSAGAEPEVVEAARRVDIAIKSISGKRIPIKFPNDEIAMTFTTIIENAGKVARALLSVPRSVKDLGVNS